MLEEKLGHNSSFLGQMGRKVGMYATIGVLSGVLYGCDLFTKYESCSKETTLTCSGEQTLMCSKPEGAPQDQCECYCRSPSKEPKDPCIRCD